MAVRGNKNMDARVNEVSDFILRSILKFEAIEAIKSP